MFAILKSYRSEFLSIHRKKYLSDVSDEEWKKTDRKHLNFGIFQFDNRFNRFYSLYKDLGQFCIQVGSYRSGVRFCLDKLIHYIP